ncbi:TPA: LysR family transcriptional regulator [Candidatus Bathyarchaeota archaeon]|nr:LysR family transcriptional regulator [Candidatus Bathyarchaeota archaeon]
MVPRFKLWLEYEGSPLMGEGRVSILEAIGRLNSIKRACESLGISYRYGWGCIRKIESRLGRPVVERRRGGYGGGGARLTGLGRMLTERYRIIEARVREGIGGPRVVAGAGASEREPEG